MGSSLSKGRAFDDQRYGQLEFQFNFSKGGDSCKGKIERYFFSKVPARHMLFHWAERDGISRDYMQELNCAMWGFLSNAVSGEAETIFKQAGILRGVEAW